MIFAVFFITIYIYIFSTANMKEKWNENTKENSDNLINCKNHKCCELTKPPKLRQKLTKFN